MIEIQCTSCHTRYRIDERVLPDETPTFKCSRCGHVFSADPLPSRARREKSKPAEQEAAPPKTKPEQRPPEPEQQQPEPPPAEPPPTFSHEEADIRREAPADAVQTAADRPAPGATVPAPPHEQLFDRLSRDFARGDEPGHSGENLAFDFNEEPSAPPEDPDESVSMPPPDDDWQVGDTPSALDEPMARLKTRRGESRGIAIPPSQFTVPPAQPMIAERHFVPGAAAYLEPQGVSHSSAAFIGLFFLVAIGFGGLSLLLCGEPQASMRMLATAPILNRHFQMPILPATLVALSDVHAAYRTIKGGHAALVVTGTARNVGPRPLHAIQIAVDLLDGQQRELAGQTTWCGNTLAPTMVAEMTPHELEFLERLEPQPGFVLDRSKEAGFELIFVDPPAGVTNLRITVAKAEPPPPGPERRS